MNKSQGLKKLGALISSPNKPIVLRGEIWTAPEVLSAVGFSPRPQGIVDMASMMESDLCFLLWSKSLSTSDLKEVAELSHKAGMGCAITMDGPFQRLSQEKGLSLIFKEMGKKPQSLQSRITEETERIVKNVELSEGLGMDLLLIADDLAYSQGLYFSPAIFRELLMPSYRLLANQMSQVTRAFGWHSDGDVSSILPDMVKCGWRFFALEIECVDLLNFKRTYGNRVTLIGGIRTAWLTQEGLDPTKQKEISEEIRALVREGGLILSSSGGIYNSKFLPTLKEIYRWIDRIEGVGCSI